MITWQHLHRSSKFTWSSRSCTCSASWTCRNISRPRVCKSNSCFLSSSLRRDLSWWSHRFFWKITSNDALMFTYFSFPWPPASVFTSHLWSAWPWTVRMSTKYLKKPGVQRSHDLPTYFLFVLLTLNLSWIIPEFFIFLIRGASSLPARLSWARSPPPAHSFHSQPCRFAFWVSL